MSKDFTQTLILLSHEDYCDHPHLTQEKVHCERSSPHDQRIRDLTSGRRSTRFQSQCPHSHCTVPLENMGIQLLLARYFTTFTTPNYKHWHWACPERSVWKAVSAPPATSRPPLTITSMPILHFLITLTQENNFNVWTKAYGQVKGEQ